MRGQYWVGDLAVEFDVTIESDSGKLGLILLKVSLLRGEIDVATGKLTLSIDGEKSISFHRILTIRLSSKALS